MLGGAGQGLMVSVEEVGTEVSPPRQAPTQFEQFSFLKSVVKPPALLHHKASPGILCVRVYRCCAG